MKFFRKKLLLTAIAFVSSLISVQTLATTTTPNCPEWEVGLLFGGFKAVPEDVTYAAAIDNTTAPFTGTYLNLKPKYRLGVGVDATYKSNCYPYLLNLSYFETSNKKNQYDVGIIFPLHWPQPSFANFAADSFSSLKTRYRLGTIALGSAFCVCDSLSITPTLGLSYSYLNHHIFVSYNNDGTPANALANLQSRFRGIGPTIGGQLGYNFCGGFSISGNLQYSALWGSLKSIYLGQYSVDTGAGIPNAFAWLSRKNVLANQIFSDVSLNYNVLIARCLCGTINLGWRFIKLYNAAEFFEYNGRDRNPALKQFNSSIQGPFIRTSIQF